MEPSNRSNQLDKSCSGRSSDTRLSSTTHAKSTTTASPNIDQKVPVDNSLTVFGTEA